MTKEIILRLVVANFAVGCLLQTATSSAIADEPHAAMAGVRPAASGLQQSCPTCVQAIGLESFRASVRGELTPVLIELQDSPGFQRRMAAERAAQPLTVRDLM